MQPQAEGPFVSIIISTRERGCRIVTPIHSILRIDDPAFELLIVDQSVNDETAHAVAPFLHDQRLCYIRSETVGVSRGQNLGLARARGDLIAITDDDCAVPTDWLTTLRALFAGHPQAALIYFDVLACPHDAERGFVPSLQNKGEIELRKLKDCGRRLGMGAGMALRREPMLEIGGFDENMGPGSLMRSGADQDIAIRTIIHGWHVLMTNQTYVIHYGFRDWQETRHLVARYAFGGGAICAKPFKAGHYGILFHMLYRVFIDALWLPFARIFKWRRPQGFKRFFFFWQGFLTGLFAPVDRAPLKYQLEKQVQQVTPELP